jgi:hypothetical protein
LPTILTELFHSIVFILKNLGLLFGAEMTSTTQTSEWFSMLNHAVTSVKDAIRSTAGYQFILQGQTVDH